MEYLPLRKPNIMDELVESVPRPENSAPRNGLPIWDVMPLSQKLPVISWPKGAVEFCRNKVGMKLWKSSGRTEFVLYDPNCYEISYHYDPLHDPNLRDFLTREPNLSRLQELGFISPTLGAFCTVKEFNEYRRYLRRIHLQQVERQRILTENANRIRIALNNADDNYERDKVARARAAKNELVKQHAEMRKQQEAFEAKKKDEERTLATKIQMENLEAKRQADAKARMEKSMAINARIQQRQIMAKEIARQKALDAKLIWAMKEQNHKAKMAAQKLEKDYNKWLKINENWESTIYRQNKTISREKRLLRKYAIMMNFNVRLRTKIVNDQRAAWDRARQKIADRYKRCRCDESAKKKKKSACKPKKGNTEAWTDKNKNSEVEHVEEVEQVINSVIGIYVHQNVSHILLDVVRDVMTEASQSSEQFGLNRNSNKNYQIYRVDTSQGTTSALHYGGGSTSDGSMVGNDGVAKYGVSFGNTVTIGSSSLVLKPDSVVRSVKNRPPTPVTSLGTLTALVCDEWIPYSVDNSREISDQERLLLDLTLDKVKRTLLREVSRKVDAGIDLPTQSIIAAHRGASLDFDVKKLAMRLTEVVLRLDPRHVLSSPVLKFTSDVLAHDVLDALERYFIIKERKSRKNVDESTTSPV